ncbi:hypothetical protein EZV62_003214 [Acer yangbiense]|uniref:NB-ARC domain-containing protein n=1 Tax=Acer yangbiense TaxID=1000413 RepID=A0A5C7IGX5_9ROSI|nr:hypothetical protein EZV62_003214 [Acer yangbiense]
MDDDDDHQKLLRKMRQFGKLLDGTRFLIVPDDVNTSEVCETLLVPICSSWSQSGGRIIVTTRDSGIFPRQKTYSALRLGRLNEEESWRLFSNKVQITEDELNNSELITFKDEILNIFCLQQLHCWEVCCLPKESYSEWSRVIARAEKPGGDMLALCYQDLPSLVKPCFIYMGLFPRGFEVPVMRLFHLWCAKGFVTPSITEKLDREDLEEICLEELVIRNMVEVRWRLDGTPKTCCMPNFLYEFFSRKAANAGFFYQHFHQSSPESSGLPKLAVWRLAAYLGIKHFPYSQLDILNLCSCTAFDTRIRGTPAREIGWPTLASEEIAEWISKLTSLETLKLVSISDDSKLASSAHHIVYNIKGASQATGALLEKLQVQMACTSNGFPKLQLSQLWNLPIKKLIVEAGAMPCLRELEIRSCQHLGEEANYISNDIPKSRADSSRSEETMEGLGSEIDNNTTQLFRQPNITEIFDDDCGDNRARSLDPNIELTTFLALFLLLHLGGADSITAYALEDNALWMRHLLGLVTQTCGIVYISP